MTEQNALAIYEQFGQLQQAASALYKSGYFTDAKSEAQAMVKVMAGAELGLPPFASMTGIHIIQGKPAIGANVIATLIKNDPRYDYRVREMTDAVCRIEFFEHGKSVGVSEFTASDARKAQTKNMDKFPKNMLFARSMSNGSKWFTPGIFGGAPVYTPEELGADVDEDGVIIEGSYSPAAPMQTPVTKPEPQQAAQKPAAKQAAAQKPTIAMLNKLHAIGTQKFGPEWDDARHELIGKLTNGRTQSSKELTYDECATLGKSMNEFADYVDPADVEDWMDGNPQDFGDK